MPYKCAKFERNRSIRRVSLLAQSYFVKWCEEEKGEEMRQFSGIHISRTTGPISFKFGMQGRKYGGDKIYKFDINRPSGYRDMRG